MIVYVPALVERLVETVSVVVPVGLEAVRVTLAMEERVGGCLTPSSFGSVSPNGRRPG